MSLVVTHFLAPVVQEQCHSQLAVSELLHLDFSDLRCLAREREKTDKFSKIKTSCEVKSLAATNKVLDAQSILNEGAHLHRIINVWSD
jgi:hypothetical protein